MEVVRKADLSIRQLAECFQCHTNLIHKMIHSGRLKAYRLNGGGPWRIPWAEVERVKAEWMYKPDVDSAL